MPSEIGSDLRGLFLVTIGLADLDRSGKEDRPQVIRRLVDIARRGDAVYAATVLVTRPPVAGLKAFRLNVPAVFH